MTWRLIEDGPATGAWNMAVDEALMLSQFEGGAPPTLRFYAWEPYCFSLGRLQKLRPHDVERLNDVDMVRRPTGGRGVWHADEVTYSVAMRIENLPREQTSVAGSYQWLSRAWLEGLCELGVRAELAPAGVRAAGFNCFSGSAGSDFLAGGKKLIGAAQCRNEAAILQHGSLLLSADNAMWERLTGGAMTSATSLRELGIEVPAGQVRHALVDGLRRATGDEVVTGSLTEREFHLAKRLHQEKYSSPSWTFDAALRESTKLAETCV